MMEKSRLLGTWSGAGLCIASMVGSGIFLSSGYMAQEMSAGPILLAWALGAGLALLGVATYAELARQIPRSGGEYRYLRELLHPAVAYVAGWVTLVVGFAQPTAINALAAATFAETLFPVVHTRLWAGAAIVLITAGHMGGASSSKWLQNLLVVAKVTLLSGFVAVGLVAGSHSWPRWTPPSGSTSATAFFGSLFYISYAFSGWNTAAYAAETFKRPERDVGRAMLIGCTLVAILYLLINWIFVANLGPSAAAMAIESEQATLGHIVAEQLVGVSGARLMSVLAIMSFVSAMSAMLMVGPHIASTMAADRALPEVFAVREGEPPRVALAFQAGVALVVLSLDNLEEALRSVGAMLMLFSLLAGVALLSGWARGQLARTVNKRTILMASMFTLFSAWLLYQGVRGHLEMLPRFGAVIAVALLLYWRTAARR